MGVGCQAEGRSAGAAAWGSSRGRGRRGAGPPGDLWFRILEAAKLSCCSPCPEASLGRKRRGLGPAALPGTLPRAPRPREGGRPQSYESLVAAEARSFRPVTAARAARRKLPFSSAEASGGLCPSADLGRERAGTLDPRLCSPGCWG